MTTKQFHFSLITGISLIGFGGILYLQTSIGLSLAALGLAISVLSLTTRKARPHSTTTSSTLRAEKSNATPVKY